MTKARVIGAIIGVFVIAAAVAVFVSLSTRTTEVRAAEVTRGDLAVVVSASGSVKAESRIEVYPPTAGTLESIEVTEGARVSAGQVLAVMDTAPLEVQAAQADAAYAGAVAQRDAAASSVPGAADRRAAQAAVDAAWGAYQLANAQYEAAKAGLGGPSPSDVAQAQLAVQAAQAAVDAANQAYDSFYNNVYLPAPEPRSAELESALDALETARAIATANLLTAQQTLNALLAASTNPGAVGAAQAARDQAYAAYLGAVAQKDALARASSVTGALSSADRAVEAASAAQALANETLTKAEIRAPADGIVLFGGGGGTALLGGSSFTSASAAGLGGAASSGGTLGPGSSVSPASAPFSIVSFETLAFEALVDETDIVRVQPGMKTMITLDGLPDEPFETEVASVGWESVTTPTGGTAFPVRLTFLTRGLPVLLGMNGSVEISVETIEDVITMPIEALSEDGEITYVYVVRGGRARRTEIEVGRFTDTRVEVRSGLAEGDLVVVSGVADLDDGTRVRVQ